MAADRPWYLRWWGIAALVYLAVTGVLGVIFLVTTRRLQPSQTAAALNSVRTGGFTDAGRRDATVDLSVPIFSERDPASGAEQPKLVIVEFSDFQCPFCRAAFPIIREAVTTYGDRGLRFIHRDFPIDEIHAEARRAAEAAQCAHAQGKFWAYHDKLFQNASALDAASLAQYAQQVGLDRAQFDICLNSRTFAAAVEEDYQAGRKLGVKGTPTWFFLPGGDVKQARRIEGVISRDALLQLLSNTLGR